jgi:hypothetical protein
MKFWRRLRYYLVGFSLGAMMVYAMFGTRGCDWTPTNRVKSAFKMCDIAISEAKLCEMNCHGIDKQVVFDLIQKGKVNFKDSRTQTEVKNYILYNKTHKIGFDLNLQDSLAVVTDFYGYTTQCSCDSLSNNLASLTRPEHMVFAEMLEKGVELNDKNRCEMNCYGITEKQLMSIFEDGIIDYAQSVPKRRPNPGYAIKKSINGNDYLFAVEVGYKTRITKIVELSTEKTCNC